LKNKVVFWQKKKREDGAGDISTWDMFRRTVSILIDFVAFQSVVTNNLANQAL